MSKFLNKETGRRGEDLAVDLLSNKGYRIVERNFRNQYGEIDIICLDGEVLVFVEVKTKIGHDFGEPEEMVNKSKLTQVRKLGEIYSLDWTGRCRVDVVGVVLNSDMSVERVSHFEAVY